ncbi:ABC transporter ATP-binding protein [Agromyces sp. SYSU T00194]|uniref:ABC transporter ATP-binding protein n=1 Tax=Agromyces chitinivorans TaxID=3158560 RepID=UPI00339A07C0
MLDVPSTNDVRPLLEVRDLGVTFESGAVQAVTRADVEVRAGERVAIVGESGSGKSTTCAAIGGFVTEPGSHVSASTLRFEDRDLLRRRTSRIPRQTPGIAMMFQDAMTSLDAVWTVGSQLEAVLGNQLKLRGKARRREAEAWLRRVGLHDVDRVMRSRPYELSGGMRQRVMLAIALCGRPRLLIADEPTSALDASRSVEMMRLMIELASTTGAAVLIVTHDIRLCQSFADRVIVMYQGCVVEDIPADRLMDASHPYTRALVECVPSLDNHDADLLPTIDGMALATNVAAREAEARVA